MSSGAVLRAVVFDMDGVLVDTEPVWHAVETAVLASLGVTLSDADSRETVGVRAVDAVAAWRRRHPWRGASTESVAARIVEGVIAHVRDGGARIDGAIDVVRGVRDAGLRCAVASSSPAHMIAAVLDAIGASDLVEVTCSADDEVHGKPAPDVYLRAAQRLGVDPADCLAVEDSVNGVLSALAAGMRCAVVPDPRAVGDPRIDAATVRLRSIRDLDGAALRRLGAPDPARQP